MQQLQNVRHLPVWLLRVRQLARFRDGDLLCFMRVKN